MDHLTRHLLLHQVDGALKCPLCTVTLARRDHLRRHLTSMHRMESTESARFVRMAQSGTRRSPHPHLPLGVRMINPARPQFRTAQVEQIPAVSCATPPAPSPPAQPSAPLAPSPVLGPIIDLTSADSPPPAPQSSAPTPRASVIVAPLKRPRSPVRYGAARKSLKLDTSGPFNLQDSIPDRCMPDRPVTPDQSFGLFQSPVAQCDGLVESPRHTAGPFSPISMSSLWLEAPTPSPRQPQVPDLSPPPQASTYDPVTPVPTPRPVPAWVPIEQPVLEQQEEEEGDQATTPSISGKFIHGRSVEELVYMFVVQLNKGGGGREGGGGD